MNVHSLPPSGVRTVISGPARTSLHNLLSAHLRIGGPSCRAARSPRRIAKVLALDGSPLYELAQIKFRQHVLLIHLYDRRSRQQLNRPHPHHGPHRRMATATVPIRCVLSLSALASYRADGHLPKGLSIRLLPDTPVHLVAPAMSPARFWQALTVRFLPCPGTGEGLPRANHSCFRKASLSLRGGGFWPVMSLVSQLAHHARHGLLNAELTFTCRRASIRRTFQAMWPPQSPPRTPLFRRSARTPELRCTLCCATSRRCPMFPVLFFLLCRVPVLRGWSFTGSCAHATGMYRW